MNLCVVVLTSGLKDSPRNLPKVCYKIGDKSMLEIVLENVIQLNPNIIILMVERNNITPINKLIKHANYSKLISYCIFDSNKESKISMAEKCYYGRNVLVVPGNGPSLSTKSMYKMISDSRNVKINDKLFYLKKDDVDKIDKIAEYSSEDEKMFPPTETLQIETREQLEKTIRKRKYGKN